MKEVLQPLNQKAKDVIVQVGRRTGGRKAFSAVRDFYKSAPQSEPPAAEDVTHHHLAGAKLYLAMLQAAVMRIYACGVVAGGRATLGALAAACPGVGHHAC